MTKIQYLFIGALFITLFNSCVHSNTGNDSKNLLPEHNEIWADTITYEVLISNPDSTNEWESTKLKHVNKQQIVDDLFLMIYNGEKKAYNYYSNEVLSIREVEEIEKRDDFDRDKVGKLQFTELWGMDKSNQVMHKKVISILLAYELYNDSNDLRGYKAAFYLKDF